MKTPAKLQQMLTSKDLVNCTCGSDIFLTTHKVAVKKSPLIGEKPAIVGIAQGFVCVKCFKIFDLEESDESNVNSPT